MAETSKTGNLSGLRSGDKAPLPFSAHALEIEISISHNRVSTEHG